MLPLNIKIKNENVKPTIGSAGAAGMDLKADTKDLLIEAGKEYTFCTGVAIEIPNDWAGLVVPRSGLGTKKGMRIKNTVGLIDSDYRGFIKITCTFTETFWLESYERIAQMTIVPHYPLYNFNVVDELPDTDRGESGFGDSGRT